MTDAKRLAMRECRGPIAKPAQIAPMPTPIRGTEPVGRVVVCRRIAR